MPSYVPRSTERHIISSVSINIAILMQRPKGKKWLPHKEYLRRLPTKHAGTGLVVLNSKDEILLVKPIYRNYWKLPGGSIDRFESPRDACVREAREELRLSVGVLTLLGVSYNTHAKDHYEDLQFYFYGGRLRRVQIERLKARANEIGEFRFVARKNAGRIMRTGAHAMLTLWYRAIKARTPFYHERTFNE